jgi:hypothetical protein
LPASLLGLEFRSKKTVHSGGHLGFTPMMARSMSAVQARCPGAQAAWVIPGEGYLVVRDVGH